MKKLTNSQNKRRNVILNACLIGGITYVLLFIMLLAGVTPEQYDIQVGQPSSVMIKATKDIVDTVTTNANREMAANAIEPTYKNVDHSITARVENDAAAVMEELHTIRTEMAGKPLTEAVVKKLNRRLNERITPVETEESDAEAADASEAELSTESEPAIEMNLDEWKAILSATDGIFESSVFVVQSGLKSVMESSLPEGQESIGIRSIMTPISEDFDEGLAAAYMRIVPGLLRPNMLIDREVTEANRAAAMENVPNVTLIKDELIVSEGERVTEAQYQMISSLGLLNDNDFDGQLVAGIALLVALLIGSFLIFMMYFYPEILMNRKKLLLLALIMLLTEAACLLTSRIDAYLLPTSLAVLLFAAFFGSRITLYGATTVALMSAPLAPSGSNNLYVFAAMTVMSAPVILLLYKKRTQRTTPLLAGVVVALVNFLTMMSFGLYNSADLKTVAINAGMTALGGMLAAMLALALQLLLETMFNQATAAKLIELADPQQKLLRRLQIEAPGTYHHSIIVANLAEAACASIGADAMLARVGSYYHDIGKLTRPIYFAENQMGENPHNRIDALVSANILRAHPEEGRKLAQKERLPEAVVDIIVQHHGDSLMKFFYNKACEKAEGVPVNPNLFRYEGPRPQTREAAVVMLADTVEAATRSLKEHSREKVEEMTRKLINDKLMEGELNDSKLTLTDIDNIIHAFSGILSGIYHDRPSYPGQENPAAPSVEKPAAAQVAKPQTEAPTPKPEKVAEAVKPSEPPKAEPVAAKPVVQEKPAPKPEEPKPAVEACPVQPRKPILPGVPVPPHLSSELPIVEKEAAEDGH